MITASYSRTFRLEYSYRLIGTLAVSGFTVVGSILDGAGQVLDFDDNTFKAFASATTPTIVLNDVDVTNFPGVYRSVAIDPYDWNPRPTVPTDYLAFIEVTSPLAAQNHQVEALRVAPYFENEVLRKRIDTSLVPWQEIWTTSAGREVVRFFLKDSTGTNISGAPGDLATAKELIADRALS